MLGPEWRGENIFLKIQLQMWLWASDYLLGRSDLKQVSAVIPVNHIKIREMLFIPSYPALMHLYIFFLLILHPSLLSSCFLSLLLVAAVVWKIKQTCWASRRREVGHAAVVHVWHAFSCVHKVSACAYILFTVQVTLSDAIIRWRTPTTNAVA